MTRGETVRELSLPLPWLAASLVTAQMIGWIAALPLSFIFFLTALRLNHEAIHRNLGLGDGGHRLLIHALSAVMLGSNTAVEVNHLRHHAHCMDAGDVEGKCGRMSFWRVWVYGPVFPIENHVSAWRVANPAGRRRMARELLLTTALIGFSLTPAAPQWVVYHVAIMVGAQCCTAFFAVWITHRGCDPHGLFARTQRGRLVNRLCYAMFFHLEHHLFPRVPTRRLGRLAERLDRAHPETMSRVRRVCAWH